MSLSPYQEQFLKDLIAIPSVGGTPEEGAPYGKVPRQALTFFLDEAERAGFTTGVSDDRVGWCEIGSGDKLIGIVCHLDVVPAGEGWDTDPFELTFKDGAMYGRGIIDDKGPAAMSFFAMKQLLEEGKDLPCRIRLILGTDEERTCSCVEHYDANCEIPDFAITPDAEYPVIYAEKGILHVKVSDKRPVLTGFSAAGGNAANMVAPSAVASYNGKKYECQGKMAHASKPDLGINAIDMLPEELSSNGFDIAKVPLLAFIKDFDPVAVCDLEDDSGKMTTNNGILKIDDNEQYLIVDIRYPVTSSLDTIMDNIRSQACAYGLEVEIDSQMDPIYKDRESDEIRLLTKVWEEHMSDFSGYKEEYRTLYSEPLAIGGGTYARHMRNTIAFGIQAPWQEDQCHQANEQIMVSDFETCVDIIRDALERLMA